MKWALGKDRNLLSGSHCVATGNLLVKQKTTATYGIRQNGICRDSGLAFDGRCTSLSEWFVPGTEQQPAALPPGDVKPVYLQHPTQGMQLAMDPRLPLDQQAFMFKPANLPDGIAVDWHVDDNRVASTKSGQYL